MPVVKVPLNAEGRIIGQYHHRAKLSDSLVQKLRDLHEKWGLGWRRLAKQFELTPITVKKILAYERRNSVAVGWTYKCRNAPSTAPSADASSKTFSPSSSPESAQDRASDASQSGSSRCPQPASPQDPPSSPSPSR